MASSQLTERPECTRGRGSQLLSLEKVGEISRDWTLRIGVAELEVTMNWLRCSMATYGFDDLPKDPSIMRTLVREPATLSSCHASACDVDLEAGDLLIP